MKSNNKTFIDIDVVNNPKVSVGAINVHSASAVTNNGTVNLNPNSRTILTDCYVEPSVADAKAYDSFQFLRNGYFCVDCKDSTPEHLVFNRIVSMKSSYKPQ